MAAIFFVVQFDFPVFPGSFNGSFWAILFSLCVCVVELFLFLSNMAARGQPTGK